VLPCFRPPRRRLAHDDAVPPPTTLTQRTHSTPHRHTDKARMPLPLPKTRRGGTRTRCSDALLLLLPNLLPLLLLDVTHAAFLMPSPSRSIRSTSTTTGPSSPSECVSLHGLRRQTCSTVAAASSSSSSQTIPPDLVDALAERPWRTGLEPAEDVDVLEVPADCIEVRTEWVGVAFA